MDKNKFSQKFSRAHRLGRSREFKTAYEQGTKVNAKYFVLYALENKLQHSRLGLTVSKKIGGAVVRNHTKRLIREIFRKSLPGFSKNYDLVINSKRSIAAVSYWDLEKDFQQALSKLGGADKTRIGGKNSD